MQYKLCGSQIPRNVYSSVMSKTHELTCIFKIY